MIKRFHFLVFAAAVLLLGGCAFVNVPLVNNQMALEEQTVEGEGRTKILLLDISGLISEKQKSGSLVAKGAPSTVAEMREALQKAEKDSNVVGVVLRINSPGGTVTASDTIYHDFKQFRSRKKVPVVACISGMGTSGAYYIAAAADEIVAHPAAITGSIGVILMTFNVEGLMSKIGVTEYSIKSGEKKDILSPFRERTAEEGELMQNIVNRLYGRFLDVIMVRAGNKLTRQGLGPLADGRIYTADEARDAGLIDRVAYLDEVIGGMKQSLRLEEAKVVTYYRPGSYKGSIYADSPVEESRPMGLADVVAAGVDLFAESRFMYLWRP